MKEYIDKIPTSVELPNTAFYLEKILSLFMFLTQIQIIRSELVVALISLPIGFLVVAKEVLEYIPAYSLIVNYQLVI